MIKTENYYYGIHKNPRRYRQIPLVNSKGRCPFCDGEINDTDVFYVELFNSAGEKTDNYIELPCCRACNIPVSVQGTRKKTRKENKGYTFELLSKKSKECLKDVEQRILSIPETNNKQGNATHKPLKPIANNNQYNLVKKEYSIWKRPEKLFAVRSIGDYCPLCKAKLKTSYTLIPVDDENCARVDGMECTKCKSLYVTDNKNIKKLFIDNVHAKSYSLNGKKYWDYTIREKARIRDAKCREMFRENPEALIVVPVEQNGEPVFYSIVSDKKTVKENNLHYSFILARELLTAVFKKDIPAKIFINAQEMIVYEPYYNKDKVAFIFPESLQIKSGGGYYDGRRYGGEMVDLLLYSSYTKRYEIIKASYERFEEYYYTDIRIFRNWVEQYGNPGIQLFFGQEKTGQDFWSSLNTKSILKGYGYSVSQEDGLSDKQRQEILAEIVDLKILSIPYIIRMLEFFINSHPSDKDSMARAKWEADKVFISNYRFNPTRFLISK